MLRIDLSRMSGAELRRLLAAAEARGQAGLAERFRAELAGRAGGGETATAAPRPIPPSDDDDDEPGPIVVQAEPPLPFELSGRRPPPARRWPVGLAAAVALAAGGATAWGLVGAPGWPGGWPGREGAAGPAPRAMTLRNVAAPAPAPAAVAVRTPEPQRPAEPSAREPPASETPTPSPKPTTLATAAPAPKAVPEPRPRRADPCATPPTPADRLLCNDLALNLLRQEARDAYGRALAAGADPAAVRASETAWRRVRDPTSDPRALAELYERRIRELRAMAAAAPASPAPPETRDRQQN
ncbi:MAG: hypothetical protein EPO51_07050 [Phenylobacterium sp.]|uniref:hypothetical protein n=1 Tax=Phenylobacterium sp. TaxID=1871053 RepID=UPI001205578B|nr:hypothetical protein [Phenylobacterium sp.]TAJ72886.1 MAG: hypothetical protein EPO51_07050 [Phenylobacterium sp.]